MTTSGSVIDAVTGTLSSVSGDALTMVSAAIPYALPIMGVGIVVAAGIKIFKRFAKS